MTTLNVDMEKAWRDYHTPDKQIKGEPDTYKIAKREAFYAGWEARQKHETTIPSNYI